MAKVHSAPSSPGLVTGKSFGVRCIMYHVDPDQVLGAAKANEILWETADFTSNSKSTLLTQYINIRSQK